MKQASLSLAAGLALAKVALAGGFWITLGNPGAHSDPKAHDAVLVVRPTGCGDATKAQVTATAEGLVSGERRTIRLHPVALGKAGDHAIRREWPAEGAWAISVVATEGGRTTSAVVPVGKYGFSREGAKFFPRAPEASEIAAVLAGAQEKLAAQR